MNVSGVTSNYEIKNYASKKTAGTSFAEKIAEKAAVSPKDMTLEEYKAYFQKKMDSLYVHPSQRNRNEVIDITDAAYERMKNDPEYEDKVLNSFAVNWAVNFGNYIPTFSYAHIDDSWEKSYGYTQGMQENYNNKSSEKTSKGLGEWWKERHERYEELIEEQVKKAIESQQATKSETSKWAGDMVVPQPPNYSGFTYNSAISDKSKDEMTMDEYKQWFMNEMSKMPVSGWVRSTCVGGELVITEEAFEKMKSDPEWEKTVLNMIRKMYSVNGIPGSKMIGYQVIGASPEECYGAGIPVKSGSSLLSGMDGKSWWQKRHERFEELNFLLEPRL